VFIVTLQLHNLRIPRSFRVINVCNQGKTLCSPYTSNVEGWQFVYSKQTDDKWQFVYSKQTDDNLLDP
jgi:hypothetical protein